MKRTQWQKVKKGWLAFADLNFWFWAFRQNPRTCIRLLVAMALTSYIDLREYRFQGERMD